MSVPQYYGGILSMRKYFHDNVACINIFNNSIMDIDGVQMLQGVETFVNIKNPVGCTGLKVK